MDIKNVEHGLVAWVDGTGAEHEEPAGRRLLARELYTARPIRVGNRYPLQRNVHGLYAMASTGKHVWFESKLESSRLAHLDMVGDVRDLASQPMKITFADGSVHFPDFIALHEDHSQVVYDVKPRGRVEKHLEAFAKTKALCALVGWGYAVLSELGEIENANLSLLRNFKHPGYRPNSASLSRLVKGLSGPIQFIEAAIRLAPHSLPQGRAQALHLLWSGDLRADLTLPLSDTTLVEGSPDA